MSKAGTKIPDKGQGASWVCLGEGEARSSTMPDPWLCGERLPWHCRGCKLLSSVPSAPAEQANPRGLARGFCSSLCFPWAELGFVWVQAVKVFPEELPQPLLPPITGAQVPISSRLEFSPLEAFPTRKHFNCSGSLQRTESLTN